MTRTSAIVLLFLSLCMPNLVRADVTLNNGSVVPADSMIVFIMIGHSNMSGRATSYGATDVDSINMIYNIYNQVDPFLWNYHSEDLYNQTGVPTGTWIPALNRLSWDYEPASICLTECLNVGMPFLKIMRTYYPKHRLGVIHVASGHAELKPHFIDNTPLHSVAYWSVLEKALTDLKGKVRFGGVIAQFGILEVVHKDASAAGAYRNNLDTLITRIRTIANDPAIPFLVSDLEQGVRTSLGAPNYPIDGVVGDTLTAQILLAQAEIPHTRMISTDWSIAPWILGVSPFFKAMDHHYNRLGMLKFAEATVDSYLKIASIPVYCSSDDLSCVPPPLSSLATPPLSSWATLASSSSISNASSSSSQPGPAFVLTNPSVASTVVVGSIIQIQWLTDLTQASDAYPEVSLDQGRTWLGIGYSTSILSNEPLWQNIPWTIPATILDRSQNPVSLSNLDVQLRITTYSGTATASTHFFVSDPPTSSRAAVLANSNGLRLSPPWLWVQSTTDWTLEICNLQGQSLLHQSGVAGQYRISMQNFPSGLYVARMPSHNSILLSLP